MSNKAIASALLSAILMIGGASASPTEKLVVLKQVNSITGELINIAQRRQALSKKTTGNLGFDEIKPLIQGQRDINVIVRVAIASRANRFPGRAEDQIVDNVMDEAWARCISRIEQIGGEAAVSSLEMLEERERLDGADSLDVRNAIERLRKSK